MDSTHASDFTQSAAKQKISSRIMTATNQATIAAINHQTLPVIEAIAARHQSCPTINKVSLSRSIGATNHHATNHRRSQASPPPIDAANKHCHHQSPLPAIIVATIHRRQSSPLRRITAVHGRRPSSLLPTMICAKNHCRDESLPTPFTTATNPRRR